MYKTYLDIYNIFLFYRLTGPRWKGEFLLVPIGIEFCSTDPGGGALRWTSHELIATNYFFKSLHKNKQFFGEWKPLYRRVLRAISFKSSQKRHDRRK